MIYFLYGADTYRLQQKVKEIKERFLEVNKQSASWDVVDAGQTSFRDFWDLFCQRSIFVNKKLIILENLLQALDFSTQFLSKMKNMVSSHNVVVVIGREDIPVKGISKKKGLKNAPNSKLLTVLLEQSKAQGFEVLSGVKLRNWVIKEFNNYGKKISNLALDKLVRLVGKDTWRLSQEINKLANYQKAAEVSAKDIGLLVRGQALSEIFATLDTLAKRDIKGALSLIDQHLQEGDDPIYLISMLAFQFRNLLLLKVVTEEDRAANTYRSSGQIAKKLEIHPFVVQKAMQLARYFTIEELKKIYQNIFEAELAVKTGQLAPSDNLRLLVSKI
ncbi:MAG: DNA polymerase III subunit delta [Candidatus Pacebacteria bacterium]|nr:DNA polymerase III subunit delta [Candidatus Paceibacterota bacterium]